MSKSSTTTRALATPNRVTAHPGEVLNEEFLKPLGMSVNALAMALRVPATRIGAIVKGERAVTADTALRLARFYGTSPEFWVNHMSTGCPIFRLAAASNAAAFAAALSKSNTRFSRSSFISWSKANSSACRLRPDGSNARPKRVSNKVMLVIQTDSAGCRSSHATTAGSGPTRINALSTLVSRIITA